MYKCIRFLSDSRTVIIPDSYNQDYAELFMTNRNNVLIMTTVTLARFCCRTCVTYEWNKSLQSLL